MASRQLKTLLNTMRADLHMAKPGAGGMNMFTMLRAAIFLAEKPFILKSIIPVI